MENDIIVYCDMGGFIFTNMVKQSIKISDNVYTKAETDNAIANATSLINLKPIVKTIGDDYYATKAEVEEALDAILAIQATLIGGAE